MLALTPSTGVAASSSAVDALRAQPCPRLMENKVFPFEELAAARAGYFDVFQRRVRLVPPVDWTQDPFDSEQWRKQLHAFWFIETLISIYKDTGDRDALAQARDLVIDWIRADSNRFRDDKEVVWKNVQASNRAIYFVLITRAAACEGLLSDGQASKMLGSLVVHGDFLASDEAYSDSNHGMFMDGALMLLHEYLPFLDRTDRWNEVGKRRLKDLLDRQVQREEGVHLEHSPAYQFIVHQFLDELVTYTGTRDSYLVDTLRRMERVAPWFVMPDGTESMMGDSDLDPAPPWAQKREPDMRGQSPTRKSGYAIVKKPGRHLAVSAGYHNKFHKQADELTFDLFEQGQRIVNDTGKYGYDTDVKRKFARSSKAHSVLTVDGENFLPKSDAASQELIYGSGIDSRGGGDGWYAIEGSNALVKQRQDVDHSRLFLYKPSVALVVVDRARSDEEHTYRRYFQLGPAVDVDGSGRTLDLEAGDFDGTLHDAKTRAEVDRGIVRGTTDPLQGWIYPSRWEDPIPRATVKYESRGRDVDHVATFGLGGAGAKADLRSASAKTAIVAVELADGTSYDLKVVRDGRRLTVSDRAG